LLEGWEFQSGAVLAERRVSTKGRLRVRYNLGCSLSYEIGPDVTFIFNLEVARITGQKLLKESLVLSPPLERSVYTDPATGNRYFGVNVAADMLALEYNAEVELVVHRANPGKVNETPISQMPLAILPFLLPSRYVPSDRLASYARSEFGSLPPGHQRVNAICGWIYDHLEYQPGSSNEETTADETLLKRAGICRDFSHLGIAFCRGLGIPARFVSCYAHGLIPSDFHAVFEAYLDGRWWLFDATRQADLDGLVRIGIGRDAAEVAFSTPFGTFQPKVMEVHIAQSGNPSVLGPRTVDAISIEETAACGSR
jgi:transglutaminase-like putative cysteine protease